MANALKGEVELKAGDQSYTLDFVFESYCEVETVLDMDLNAIMASLQPDSMRLNVLKTVLWGCLQKHHPGMTLIDAAKLFNVAGLPTIATAVGGALNEAEWVGSAVPAGGAKNPPARVRAPR